MQLNRQDILNLLMIFGPILMIPFFLLTIKDAVGCGLFGWLLGGQRIFTDDDCRAENLPWALQTLRNSAVDAGIAGW
ncbi:MAG: hypothetical protein AAGD04_06045 [Pseudomonadota bacterium]